MGAINVTLPDDLHKFVKVEAAQKGKFMNELIVEIIKRKYQSN